VTQVDFYILKSASDDELLRLASRIAEKAVDCGQRVYLNAENEAQAQRLDEVLWTFAQGSFLPHRVISQASSDEGTGNAIEPVLIGAGIELSNGPWNTLVNLAHAVPEFFSRYERVAEVVDANAERRNQGRERYRYYRDRGYELKTHNVAT
jgi:DNA polymerase-3 subunit chi